MKERERGSLAFRHATRLWKGRRERAEKRLFRFLIAYSKTSHAERKHYERVTGRKAPKPLTKKEREAWAKKALAKIKGSLGLTLEMMTITEQLEEWWAKEKNDQQKRAGQKGRAVVAQNKDAALKAAIDGFMEQGRKDNEALGFR